MVHLLSARMPGWRRFTDLTIKNIPANTRLVVLAGPNGNGKSSVFDGFRAWQGRYIGYSGDTLYTEKVGILARSSLYDITLDFHEQWEETTDFATSAFTFRTAYRIEADFTSESISMVSPSAQRPRITRMSDTDSAVSQNYQHLMSSAVNALFGSRERKTGDIQDELLGAVRAAMGRIFGEELQVENLTNPLQGGAFYFSKGASRNWHYKNLSAGERAAFDLILDMAVKVKAYPNSIHCIDEPEIHLNTRVQASLLAELLNLLPAESQLWIATHSIGMMKEAHRQSQNHGVAFLDFEGHNMDEAVVLCPTVPNRKFWLRTLRVALDDLAELVAPSVVVLVEGRPKWESGGSGRGNVEFDARCLRKIFGAEFPDVEFISVGGADAVQDDRFKLGATLPMLTPGAQLIRVVDKDERSDDEITSLRSEGVRVLGLRDLENYLLSDEVLGLLCAEHDPSATQEILDFKGEELTREAASREKAEDDVKNISGSLHVKIKSRLGLKNAGNSATAFMSDTMTSFITSETRTYIDLKRAIFGDD